MSTKRRKRDALPGQGTSKKAQARRAKRQLGGVQTPIQKRNDRYNKINQQGVREKAVLDKRQRGKKIIQAGNIKIDAQDIRLQYKTRNASTNNYLANAENSLAYDVAANPLVFQGFPMGLISWCMARGFGDAADTTSIPYLAFCYLVSLMQAYALNNVPQGILVPKCVQIVGQSTMQKTVKAGGGAVTYKFAFQTSSAPNANTNVGPLTTNSWNLFVPTSTTVNNTFYVGGEPTVYTQELGQSAWTALLQFLVASNTEKNPMLELVSPSGKSKYLKSVSAFAVVLADPGGGFASVGGLGSQKSLEVPIFHPALAVCYSNTNNLPDSNRYSEYTLASAGDGLLLGALAAWLPESFLKSRRPVTYKPYDGLEYIDVYALVLTKAFAAMFADSEFQTQINAYSNSVDLQAFLNTLQCPITLQDFILCMRSQLMNVVKDTQPFVQTVFPRTEASDGENLFAAWIASISQCALPGQTQMFMPTILIENIKAMTYLIADKGVKSDPVIIVPILGSYLQDYLNYNDYSVTVSTASGATAVFDVFAPAGSEVSISVIDGLTPTSQVMFINEPASLQMLITPFNSWLQNKTQLTSFMSKTTTITTDAGATILTNNNLSTYWLTVQDDEVQKVSSVGTSKGEHNPNVALRKQYWTDYRIYLDSLATKKPMPVPKTVHRLTLREKRFGVNDYSSHHLDTSVYAQKQIIDYSARYPPLAATWENLQGFWIKPVFNAVNEGTQSTSNQVLRIAAQQREFIQIVPSAGTEAALTLAQQHDQFADVMVGARNSIKGQAFEKMFDDLSARGLGGIFSDLAGAFGSAMGAIMPVVGQAAQVARAIMPVLTTM